MKIKNDMITLTDSMVISTISVNVGSDKPLRKYDRFVFNESIADFYAILMQ